MRTKSTKINNGKLKKNIDFQASENLIIISEDENEEVQIIERKEDEIVWLIGELKRGIQNGDSEKAANAARRLSHHSVDLNITLDAYERVGIIGNNGKAKTTAATEAIEAAATTNTPPSESPAEQVEQQLRLQKVRVLKGPN